jgi:hypothetical protein
MKKSVKVKPVVVEIPEMLAEKLKQLPESYPDLAMRTNKPGEDILMTDEKWRALFTGYPMIMEGCFKADRMKAVLIYNDRLRDLAHSSMPACPRVLKPEELELLHAILGLISEGGELLTMFMDRITANKPIDRVNAKEEAGDILWFAQLLIKSLGATPEELQAMNIKKLFKRFGDKYSDLAGTVRDTEAEHALLHAVDKEQDAAK